MIDDIVAGMVYMLYTDGGARNNPGHAGIGIVLKDSEGKVVEQFGGYVGVKTNNEAEYLGLIAGLKTAATYKPSVLKCHLDSLLVVNQLNGKFKIKQAHLQELVRQVKSFTDQFEKVEFVYIPRGKNSEADSLVNKALDGHLNGG